jgi:mono/diheme cytochrome c family protein
MAIVVAVHSTVCAGSGVAALAQANSKTSTKAEKVPVYKVDSGWPKALPNDWILGAVCGVAVDSHGNIWIAQRPARVPDHEPAPPVLEFTSDGTLLAGWGGPATGYDWPRAVHGIYVDLHDNVWVGGAGSTDNQLLKFTSQGKFLLQIGHPGQNRGSNDTENLGSPASMVVDEAANELYVADGYVNHRVIVFDETTGAYKRQWGAYGKAPDDSYYAKQGIKPGEHTDNGHMKRVPAGAPPPQLDLVHSIRLSKDGLVYVCDRSHNRIQVFRKDGTFLQEAFISNNILASGSAGDIDFSTDPEQRFAFVLNGNEERVDIVDRQSLKVLDSFGEGGYLPGQFQVVHNIAVDPKGDLFITESMGRRVQKFVQVGNRDADFMAASETFQPQAVALDDETAPPASPARVVASRLVWEQHCAGCHGTVGQTNYKSPGPRLDSSTVDALGPDLLKTVISRGVSGMPSFKSDLNTEKMDQIIEYLRTVPPAPKPTPAQ